MSSKKSKPLKLEDVRDKALRDRLLGLAETIPSEPPLSANDNSDTSMRPAPKQDAQPDFFVPSVYDIPVKDGVDLMDIAVFRLSKKQTRKGDIIRYELPGTIVEVAGGAHGMATIYDYDIVLMAISQLANEVKLYRANRAGKPGRVFCPHSSEIFKFCRTGSGGAAYDRLSGALDRLQGTFIKIESVGDNKKARRTGYFPLISGANVVSRTNSGRIGSLEIIIPEWVYDGVCKLEDPSILTMNPDYFLLKKGLARLIYRLARKAAGNTEAVYGFSTIYERSGSTREFKKFVFELRALIAANDLPDYDLSEEEGKDGSKLVMRAKRYALQATDGPQSP